VKKEGGVDLPNGIGIRGEGSVDFSITSIDFGKFADDDAGGKCVGGVWEWRVCIDVAVGKAGPPGIVGTGGIPVINDGQKNVDLGRMPKDDIPNSDNIGNTPGIPHFQDNGWPWFSKERLDLD
jgi:hypothetical protein